METFISLHELFHLMYHDGRTIECRVEKEKLNDMEYDALLNCRGKTLTLAMYV